MGVLRQPKAQVMCRGAMCYTKVESKQLHRLVCDTLNVFADFCNLIVTLRKRGGKIKVALKQGIAGEDGDLKRFKSKLEHLGKTESKLVGATMLDGLPDLRKNKEQRDDQRAGDARHTIAADFRFPLAALKPDDEPRLAWKQVLINRASNLVDEMGG